MGRKKKDITNDPRYETLTQTQIDAFYKIFQVKYTKREAEIHNAGFDTYWENMTGETEVISKEEFRDAYYTERNDMLTKNMERGAFDLENGGYIEPTPNTIIDRVIKGMVQRFGEETAIKYVEDAMTHYGLYLTKEDLMFHTEQAQAFWDLVKRDQDAEYQALLAKGYSAKTARKEAGRIISSQIFGSL